MYRLFTLIAALALAACGTPPAGVSPGQNLVNLTNTSCKDLNAAMVATDQAVLSGVLKKAQAEAAIKGFEAAQAGCVTALTTIQAAQPASGAKP